MTEISRPWNGTVTGDAGPYSDANWQQLYRAIIGYGAARSNNGVFLMSGTEPNDGLKVQAQAGPTTSVDVLLGAALVQGIAYFNTTTKALTPAANASGNPRIDTIVLQADYALQTVRLVLKQGTPAVSPVAPALTQTVGVMWEIPIADLALANGFTSIAQTVISPRQEWVNAPPSLFLDHILNNSGAALNDGDVVIWDSAADRAVTTTTTLDNELIAGVWRGQTATAGYGRLQTAGIGYVNASAAVTRGRAIVTSTSAKAAVMTTTRPNARLGRALETTSASGLVLCNIDIRTQRGLQFTQTADRSINTSSAENTLFGTGLGSLSIPANLLIAGTIIEVELRGTISTLGAAPGTLTLRGKLGGSTLCTSPSATLTVGLSAVNFVLKFTIAVRTGGATGTVVGSGEGLFNNSTAANQIYGMATAGSTVLDMTGALTLDVTEQFSVSSVSNAFVINQAYVRVTPVAA